MDIVFRIILALIFIIFIAHRAYYNRKYPPSTADTVEEKKSGLSTYLSALLVIIGLVALVIYLIRPQLLFWASIPMPDFLRWIGVGIAVAGFGLLQWSQNTLSRNWSDKPRIMGSQELVTEGPYYWVRHPIYTAFLVILGSTLLISANWFLGAAWIGMVVLDITGRIQYEEQKMISHFGDPYLTYMERTGRFFPRIN